MGQPRLWLALVVCLSMLSVRPSLGDTVHDGGRGSKELPRHALAVLGDDRFTIAEHEWDFETYFQDAKHVLVISGKNAARFDVPTGNRTEFTADVGTGFLPGLQRAGTRWVFGTKWKDGQSLITIGDMTFREPAREIKRTGEKQALALSDDGRFLAILETTDTDLHIDLVDVERDQVTWTIPPPEFHSGGSWDNPRAWFVRGGRVLVVAQCLAQNGALRYRFFPVTAKGSIGEPICTDTCSERNNAWSLQPTRDDDHVLLVGNSTIALRNFANGKTVGSVKLPVSANGAAATRDNSLLATCGVWGLIHLQDVVNRTTVRTIDTGESLVQSVSFSPDDRTLASVGSFGRVRLWDVATGAELQPREYPSFGNPVAVAMAPDGRSVAVADDRGNAQVWDVGTGKPRELEDDPVPGAGGFDPWTGPNFLAYAPDGHTLIGGSNAAHNSINVWNAATGKRLAKVAGHQGPIMSVAYSPDGTRFASTSRDSTLRAWDLQGNVLDTFPDASASLAFFPDSDRIAACHGHGKGDGLRVYSLQTRRMEKKLHAPSELARHYPWAYSVAVAPEGTPLASVHRDGVVRLWDLNHDAPIREIRLREDGVRSAHTPGCVAFTPDSKTLIASAGTSSIFLCDVKTGGIRGQLDGHRNTVTSFALNKKGDLLASVGSDYHVIVWSLRSALAGAQE
jgi:WD40 repeat protein